MENIPLKFPILPVTQYRQVLHEAAELVRTQELREPTLEQFQTKRISAYPPWFMGLVVTALVFVMIFSFIISAGKQAAAMGLLMDNLPSRFNHLSQGWADMSIAFSMLLTEAGTVFFLVCSGTIAKGRTSRWTLRGFAALCALIAIVANITITALDMVGQAIVLQWILTLVIPIIVLGLGLIMEQLVIDALKVDRESKRRFEEAQQEYETVRLDPSQHSAYLELLSELLYQEMLKMQVARNIIKQLIETDPRYKRWLVSTEYRMQQETGRIDTGIDVSALLKTGDLAAPQIEATSSVSKNVSRSPVSRVSSGPSKMKRAMRWLESNPGHGLSIQAAADKARVSKATMDRAMKQFSSNGHKE